MPSEKAIAAAHRDVVNLDAQAKAARARRDRLIREAIAAGVTAYRIAKLTGLTQRAIHKIRDSVPHG